MVIGGTSGRSPIQECPQTPKWDASTPAYAGMPAGDTPCWAMHGQVKVNIIPNRRSPTTPVEGSWSPFSEMQAARPKLRKPKRANHSQATVPPMHGGGSTKCVQCCRGFVHLYTIIPILEGGWGDGVVKMPLSVHLQPLTRRGIMVRYLFLQAAVCVGYLPTK